MVKSSMLQVLLSHPESYGIFFPINQLIKIPILNDVRGISRQSAKNCYKTSRRVMEVAAAALTKLFTNVSVPV